MAIGNRMVTWPMTSHDPERSSSDPSMLRAHIWKTAGDAIQQQSLITSLLWGSTVGYPSDSSASCSVVMYRFLLSYFGGKLCWMTYSALVMLCGCRAMDCTLTGSRRQTPASTRVTWTTSYSLSSHTSFHWWSKVRSTVWLLTRTVMIWLTVFPIPGDQWSGKATERVTQPVWHDWSTSNSQSWTSFFRD